MKFDINDVQYKNYAVYLDGKLQKSAIEADDILGWVKLEEYLYLDNNMKYNSLTKSKYGRVHIVRMEDSPQSEYRDMFIIIKYNC